MDKRPEFGPAPQGSIGFNRTRKILREVSETCPSAFSPAPAWFDL